MGEGDLDGQAPLRSAHVEDCLVLLPGELGGDGAGRAQAPGGHGLEVPAGAGRVLVQASEVAFDVGLRLSGAEGGCQRGPHPVAAHALHLGHPFDVRGLAPVKEKSVSGVLA